MIEEHNDTCRQSHRICHFQCIHSSGFRTHAHPVYLGKYFVDPHVIMICHNGKCCPEEADHAHERSLEPLLPAFVLIHADPFHQYICLSYHLHIYFRTEFLHETHQLQAADHAAFFSFFRKMADLDGI